MIPVANCMHAYSDGCFMMGVYYETAEDKAPVLVRFNRWNPDVWAVYGTAAHWAAKRKPITEDPATKIFLKIDKDANNGITKKSTRIQRWGANIARQWETFPNKCPPDLGIGVRRNY